MVMSVLMKLVKKFKDEFCFGNDAFNSLKF